MMTAQEAIEVIKSNRPTSGYTILNEALDIAIDALEQLPELQEKAWMYDECNK